MSQGTSRLVGLILLPGVCSFGWSESRADTPMATAPNIIVIVADDFGVDLVGAYAEGAAPPCTPNIDALATEGLLFRNAWAYPTCSPTRAALLTGRHGFRTGVGDVLLPTDAGLQLSEVTTPEMLVGYDTAAIGKWHVAGSQNIMHPNDSGFARYAGVIGGGVDDYFEWRKVTDGQRSTSTTYVPIETADDAIAAMQTMQSPWFLHVAFNAPHTPLHVPPTSVCGTPTCPTSYCGNLPQNATSRELVKAMTEGMDHEIGRVLAALDGVDPNALVVFMGDNGTANQGTESPFVVGRAKGTLYEGGLNVPLIIRGPGVAVGETQGLVSVTDLFATFAECAGVPSLAEDSVSMVPYFEDPSLTLRTTVYSEIFTPSGSMPTFADHQQAIRDARYKLIRRVGEADEFYDLDVDPFEEDNRLPDLTRAEQLAYVSLVEALEELSIECAGDANGDGAVDFTDLITVLSAWGPCGVAPCSSDFDDDGEVGFADVLIVISAWGPC